MKPNPSTIAVEGKMPVKGRKMFFDPESIAHIMRLLIDLYSDKELAVIRELSTNAIDSHIMAGVKAPITVQTPTPLSQYLVIQDQGLGLSVDEIYELFGGYGASTKRGTNEATGMLGLGSKSPLTYTNQFTMTAVKDGIEAVVAIIRGEDGVGELNVVDTRKSTEPNGVTIKIPAKTGNTIDRKAKTFFQYWKSGTVTLNGVDPSGLQGATMQISDSIWMMKGDRYSTPSSVIVMGNVPYPCEALDYTVLNIPPGHYIAAYVPIGDVDFAPSREALQESKKTRDTIERVRLEFKKGLQGAVQRDIETAKTALEAMDKMHEWQSLFNGGGYRNTSRPDFTWQGNPLPWTLEAPKRAATDRYGSPTMVWDKAFFIMDKWYQGYGRSRSNASKYNEIDISTLLTCVFVTDYTPDAPTANHRQKATQWLEKQTFTNPPTKFVMMDFKVDLSLFPNDRVVSWDVIKQEKLPKKQTYNSGRIPGSFDLVLGGVDNRETINYGPGYRTPSREGVPGDDIDQNYPIYWYHGNMQYALNSIAPVLDHFQKKYTVICLPENRLAKFKRDNPKIENADDVVKVEAQKISDKMTDDQKKALWLHDVRERQLKAWVNYVNKIHDPEFKELVELAILDIKGVIKSRDLFYGGVRFPTTEIPDFESIKDRYPLVEYTTSVDEHYVRYINSEYAYLKKTGAVK